jgi:hypothetical protein
MRRTRHELNEWKRKCVDEGWKDGWSLKKEGNLCVNEIDAKRVKWLKKRTRE